ncbi:MAG: hypothetical protein JW943_14455 [Deltaproteobacteria bacterium]|nr:hypothetical protein [Deltaproteobacteria bacterium]
MNRFSQNNFAVVGVYLSTGKTEQCQEIFFKKTNSGATDSIDFKKRVGRIILPTPSNHFAGFNAL